MSRRTLLYSPRLFLFLCLCVLWFHCLLQAFDLYIVCIFISIQIRADLNHECKCRTCLFSRVGSIIRSDHNLKSVKRDREESRGLELNSYLFLKIPFSGLSTLHCSSPFSQRCHPFLQLLPFCPWYPDDFRSDMTFFLSPILYFPCGNNFNLSIFLSHQI